MEEEKINELFEEITLTLFFSSDLNGFVCGILEDMGETTFEEFENIFNYEIETDYNDFLKWELIKNYATFDNYRQVEFETIKKDFLQDIKHCFEVVKC